MGDTTNISHVTNSVINVKSKLDNARQLVKTLPQTAPDVQNKLEDLLIQLSTQLQTVPKEKSEDAEIVAEMTESLVEDAKNGKPKKKLQITGKGLLEAAEALVMVVPKLISLLKKIVETVTGL